MTIPPPFKDIGLYQLMRLMVMVVFLFPMMMRMTQPRLRSSPTTCLPRTSDNRQRDQLPHSTKLLSPYNDSARWNALSRMPPPHDR